MTFIFLLVSTNGAIPAFEVAYCHDREAAQREAEQVLSRSPERRAIEVWDETKRICVVERPRTVGGVASW